MKASSSVVASVAVSAALCVLSLPGCSGGGSSMPPSTAAKTTTPTTSGSVPISSLNVMQPASTTTVNATGSTPASANVDIGDQSTLAVTATSDASTISDHVEHLYAGGLRGPVSASARRSAQDVAVNSPLDLLYHGGTVLGSAVSHNVFVNYDATTRAALNFKPGKFLSDLGKDQFITLLYQYLATPGVTVSTPITGRYAKGMGADITVPFKPPLTGDTNPYFGQLDIFLAILATAAQPGLGGGGDRHIYHVFLPHNVDTCFERPLGIPTATCYSPDNRNTFVFCAYHGAFSVGAQIYLFTVEPYQDVSGCRNAGVRNQTLPNAVSPTVDPADPGYSTLSHELFETISDPHINGWYNDLLGFEIGDLCGFDNFVKVNGNSYVLQSEYSDVNHICVSAQLNGDAQTPQGGE